MGRKKELGFVTSKKERWAYGLFFLGQNILWGYAGYVETFLTDIGIAAASAAMILLLPKLWDAVNDVIFGYACIDYEGEPAYNELKGNWLSPMDAPYVVVHRMAFAKESRGKGLGDEAFRLVAEQAKGKGIENFRVDTDEANKIMQRVLKRNGFTYCGVIWFDNSEKIAFEKKI